VIVFSFQKNRRSVLRPFQSLTLRGQVGRLRRVAEIALSRYDIGPYRLKKLGYLMNCSFRVEASAGRFLLRVASGENNSPKAVDAEGAYLEELGRNTRLRLPVPVSAVDGSRCQVVTVEGVPEGQVCALFRWVEGRVLSKHLSMRAFTAVARSLGELHQFSESYRTGPRFVRYRYDWQNYFAYMWQQISPENPALKTGDWDVLGQVEERGRKVLDGLGKRRKVYGMIHGDFYHSNYVFNRGEVGIIDFDWCGLGFYLFDIANAVIGLPTGAAGPEMRSAFLEEYSSVRPDVLCHLDLIDDFIAVRFFIWLIYWLGNSEHPRIGVNVPGFVSQVVPLLRGYLDQGTIPMASGVGN